MSGSPKYSQAELEQRRQQQLEAERRQRAAEEERQRQVAAEQERQRRVEVLRQRERQALEAEWAEIQQPQANLYPQDRAALQQRGQELLNALHRSTQEPELRNVTTAREALTADRFAALTRKRRDDAEKQRQADLERQAFELAELQQQIAQIPEADRQKFDAAGVVTIQQQIATVRQALAKGNPQQVKQPLQQAIATVQQHCDRVLQQRTHWQQRQAEAMQQQGELQALRVGLEADPVVMRWKSASIAQIATLIQQSETAIRQENFEQVAQSLKQGQDLSQDAIAEANTDQLKADQRDYIANSIAQTLEEMGFTIVHRQMEHADHPASAVILGAATHSGKALSVSVPVEGEVFYDVDGYAKSTVAAVGGGMAAVCDEAEQVLDEMHQILGDRFGVKMGEVQWQGKDPDRQLRKADHLPSGNSQTSHHRS